MNLISTLANFRSIHNGDYDLLQFAILLNSARSDLERRSQISPAGVKSAYLILFPRREANIFSGVGAVKLSVCLSLSLS